MGIMRPLDTAVVRQVEYDLLTPEAVAGEYKEEIGAACSNPSGHKKDYIFLAMIDEIQCLVQAKNDISFGDALILNSNCKITNFNEVNETIMQAVEAEKQDIIDNRDAINSFASSLGPVENDETAQDSYLSGEQFVRNGKLCEAIANITAGDALVLNSNYAYADSLSEQVSSVKQDLTTYEKTCNNHNIPRLVPKDISSYISDGTFYKRLNGTDGFTLFEDIYVGDYIKMSRAITAPNQDSQYEITGSQYVTIIGLDTLMKNYGVSYHQAVMTAGQGFGGTQHFGRKRMYASLPFTLGYVGSEMNTDTLGSVASSGSTASGATINQQLYAEFGSHLKTTSELLSTANDSTGVGRFGTASGCATNWAWTSVQAVLMSEIEVYGSVVWGASGYDIGTAKEQFPLFAFSKEAMNNGSAYYWLKDIASGSNFCFCFNGGSADYRGATDAGHFVRPRFVIGA